jgi:hypothetical protein
MKTVHRRFVPEQSTFQRDGKQPDRLTDQLGISKASIPDPLRP